MVQQSACKKLLQAAVQAVFGANRLHVPRHRAAASSAQLWEAVSSAKTEKLWRGLGFVVEQTAQLAGGLPVGIGRAERLDRSSRKKAARQRSFGPVEGLEQR